MAQKIETLTFSGDSPGAEFKVPVYRFGTPRARPKAYLQAALHADEQPGMMALFHLIDLLRDLDAKGLIQGEIIVIPAVNPFGLAQITHHTHLGRYHAPLGQNYNRGWPSLTTGLADAVADQLNDDEDQNVQIIRKALAARIDSLPQTRSFDAWRKQILRLAYDADMVLDLHCDEPSLVHIFIMPQLIPAWHDLSAWIGAAATLTAEDSGGGSFDEVFPTPWVQLQRAFPDHPIPLATGAATLEFRGRADVSDTQGLHDAQNLLGFLSGRGMIADKPQEAPALLAEASPLEATTYIRMLRPGLLSYDIQLGDHVKAGQHVASLIAMDTIPHERVSITAPIDGQILSTNSEKYVRPGDSVAKIVGAEVLEARRGGYLLED